MDHFDSIESNTVADLTEHRRRKSDYDEQRHITIRALRVAEAEMRRLQEFGRERQKR